MRRGSGSRLACGSWEDITRRRSHHEASQQEDVGEKREQVETNTSPNKAITPVPRKQRHTARRVWQRLIEEETAVVAESSVRALVAELKVEVGLVRRQVAVPQTHAPAQEADVDFGEFTAAIAGTVMKLWMFCLRLSHSGKAVLIAYANQARDCLMLLFRVKPQAAVSQVR